MIVPMRVYKKFLTKKKLSSYSWTYWGFALITTIGIGFLFTIVELLKTHDRRIVFYNLRTINTDNNRIMSEDKETYLSNDSPVFVFIRDNVLFGSMRNVIAPMPNNDVLVLGNNWESEFKNKIRSYKNWNKIFPSTAVGVLFDTEMSYNKSIERLNSVYNLIEQENKRNIINKNQMTPSIVLLDLYKNN